MLNSFSLAAVKGLASSLVFFGLSTQVWAALPQLQYDAQKKIGEDAVFFRVVNGQKQAARLPKLELDLSPFDCDEHGEEKCFYLSTTPADAYSILSSEMLDPLLNLEASGESGPYTVQCSAKSSKVLYNVDLKTCRVKTSDPRETLTRERFVEKQAEILAAVPLSISGKVKALKYELVKIPALQQKISLDLQKMTHFLRGYSQGFQWEKDEAQFLPLGVAFGLVQAAIGYNPCGIGYGEDYLLKAPSLAKGFTDNKGYNVVLFASKEAHIEFCQSFRDSQLALKENTLYRKFLLEAYDLAYRTLFEMQESWQVKLLHPAIASVDLAVVKKAAAEETVQKLVDLAFTQSAADSFQLKTE